MLISFFRAAILYVLVVVLMRSMGKRQVGELQPFELVIAIMIADLASTPMSSPSIPLAHGVMPVAALVLLQSIFTLATLKSDKMRTLINGKPSTIIRNGVVDEKELHRQAITLSEILEEARIAGYPSLSKIGVAILEVSGDLSIFPISQQRPLTAMDMGIQTGYEGASLALVLDGKMQIHNLKDAMLDESWLVHKLADMGMQPEDVLIASIDTTGVLCVQRKKTSQMYYHQVLSPQEVRW